MIEFPSELGVPIKTWTEGVPVEDDAKAQLQRIARLPIVWPHLAVMPDVHLGIGATVGSVVPTRNAIIPSAVGVDIGCVDKDSEYLSPTGWRKISEYYGGPVMQYDPRTGRGQFVQPENYIKRESRGFLHFKTKYGIDQMLSPDHKVLLWKITGRQRNRVMGTMTAQALAEEHERLVIGAKVEFQTTFEPELGTSLRISNDLLRLQVAVMADAHLDGRAAVVQLKKERKKVRLQALLQAANVHYTQHERDDGCTVYRFAAPVLTKTYAEFWNASLDQLRIIAEECLHWDGNHDDHVFFTRDRASADFIQYAFTAIGLRAVLRADDRIDGATDYRVFGHENILVGLGGSPKSTIERVPSFDGFEYCFTVPSGFWVMRRAGNVVMTGNCGMMAVKLNIRAEHLPDSLAAMRSAIESAVPHGRSNNGGPGDKGAWGMVPVDIGHAWVDGGMYHEYREKLVAKHPKVEAKNTVNHLGTLGTGNHFIEVCLDEGGYCPHSVPFNKGAQMCGCHGVSTKSSPSVWVMLHSGSRGVGNRIGSYFIELAKQDMKTAHGNLPEDDDLAYLTEGTQFFDDYVEAVTWAQNFARINRETMMERVLTAIENHMREIGVFGGIGAVEEAVNCHHNYVQLEDHFGAQVYVTRKGAVSARKDELGIIPGSMGAKSFIVRGKGNEDSFHSCSHGAGRKMSRNAAKKKFTLEDHAKATAGVECRKDADVIDETPGAYKSIDDVMAAQSDLVEVVATLKQILCVKG